MASDVARLRFVMSAGTDGLKSGCKEAVGSLKDMSSQAGSAMGKLDSGGIDWKGLKKSARGLKFVGREMGGMFKGGIGDIMGIATTGAAFGVGGAAVAAGAAGINMYQKHEEQLEKDRTKAQADYRGAASHGIAAGTYRELSTIAGDDTKFLDDLAGGMKELKDAGPDASAALKSFGDEVKNFGRNMGLKGEAGKEVEEGQLTKAGEKRMEDMGQRKDWFGNDQAKVMEERFTQKYQNEGMEEKEAKKKAREKMSGFTTYSVFGGSYELTGGGTGDDSEESKKYQSAMAELETDAQKQEKQLRERSGLLRDPKLKTNKEKLNEQLGHYRDLQKGIDEDTSLSPEAKKSYSEKIGRGAEEAIGEYKKAQGGPVEMAGAMQENSVQAYSTIANAQMAAAGAQSDTAETNAILEKHFPELIKAIKDTKSDWRRADAPG